MFLKPFDTNLSYSSMAIDTPSRPLSNSFLILLGTLPNVGLLDANICKPTNNGLSNLSFKVEYCLGNVLGFQCHRLVG